MALITVPDAAERLKTTRQAVYLAIREGRLTRHEQYGKVLVDEAEVATYKPNAYGTRPSGRGAGRPRQAKEGSPHV